MYVNVAYLYPPVPPRWGRTGIHFLHCTSSQLPGTKSNNLEKFYKILAQYAKYFFLDAQFHPAGGGVAFCVRLTLNVWGGGKIGHAKQNLLFAP